MNQDLNPFLNDVPDIIDRMIHGWKNSTNFCSIGSISSINSSPVSVNVQPLVKYFDPITKWETFPVIKNVPITQMSNNLYSIKTPVNVGDVGIILWFDREVYSSLMQGAQLPIIPDSGDLNDQNACIFIPIVQSFATANQLKQTGVEFVSSEISLIQQLLTLLSDLTLFCTTVSAAPTTNPLTPVYAAAIAGAATALNLSIATLTTALTTFKGTQT